MANLVNVMNVLKNQLKRKKVSAGLMVIETCGIQKRMEESQLVYVADRESDIYELFTEGVTGEAHWLIRAVRNRKTIESNKIRDQLAKTAALGELTLKLSHRKKRKRRKVSLTIYTTRLLLSGPSRPKQGKLPNVPVTAILAIEESPPKNEAPIEWLILTDMTVSSLKEAQEKLHWYSCRWQIEIFFNTLKSGCQVEKLQLETRDRLESAIALYMIIAWRLLYIRTLNRLFPESTCDLVFEKEARIIHGEPYVSNQCLPCMPTNKSNGPQAQRPKV